MIRVYARGSEDPAVAIVWRGDARVQHLVAACTPESLPLIITGPAWDSAARNSRIKMASHSGSWPRDARHGSSGSGDCSPSSFVYCCIDVYGRKTRKSQRAATQGGDLR